MNDITFEILKIIVSAVATLVGLYLIPYLHRKTKEIIDTDVAEMVAVAVRAAEQTYKKSGMGKQKKADVIAFVSAWLKDKHIYITESQLDNLIESAVFSMNREA